MMDAPGDLPGGVRVGHQCYQLEYEFHSGTRSAGCHNTPISYHGAIGDDIRQLIRNSVVGGVFSPSENSRLVKDGRSGTNRGNPATGCRLSPDPLDDPRVAPQAGVSGPSGQNHEGVFDTFQVIEASISPQGYPVAPGRLQILTCRRDGYVHPGPSQAIDRSNRFELFKTFDNDNECIISH